MARRHTATSWGTSSRTRALSRPSTGFSRRVLPRRLPTAVVIHDHGPRRFVVTCLIHRTQSVERLARARHDELRWRLFSIARLRVDPRYYLNFASCSIEWTDLGQRALILQWRFTPSARTSTLGSHSEKLAIQLAGPPRPRTGADCFFRPR